MIGHIIEAVRATVEQIGKDQDRDILFEYDDLNFINVKMDTVRRDQIIVYVEEIPQRYYNIPYRGRESVTTTFVVYFCSFEKMHNDAYKGTTPFSDNHGGVTRLFIRDSLEEQALRPFLAAFKSSVIWKRYPNVLESTRVLYPYPRFDANEVSVGVEMTIREDVCLKKYLPGDWGGGGTPAPTETITITYVNEYQGAEQGRKEFEYPKGSFQAVKPANDYELNFNPFVPQLTFKNWNTDPLITGTFYEAGEVLPTDEDLTLYTNWVTV